MAKQIISDTDLENILGSLDGLKKADPKPFFFTRLQARMKGSEEGFLQKLVFYVTRPAFAMSIGIMILLFNGYFLFNSLQPREEQQEETVQMLAVEYSSLNAPYYESTEDTP